MPKTELPTKAYELLAKPDSWTQGEYAETDSGRGVEADSPDAVCWCAWGAIIRVYGVGWETIGRVEHRVGDSITAWNDNPDRTHAEVLAVLKELDI